MKRTLTLISIIFLACGALTAGQGHGHHRSERGMMNKHDLNEDGQVTFEEFTESMREHFDKMDQNGDGVITEDDVQALHEEMQANRSKRMIQHVGSRLVRQADGDESKTVTREEWTAFVSGLATTEDGALDLSSLMRRSPRRSGGERAGQRHLMLDRNENGMLDPEDLQLLFDELDSDGSGILELTETHKQRRRHKGR